MALGRKTFTLLIGLGPQGSHGIPQRVDQRGAEWTYTTKAMHAVGVYRVCRVCRVWQGCRALVLPVNIRAPMRPMVKAPSLNEFIAYGLVGRVSGVGGVTREKVRCSFAS